MLLEFFKFDLRYQLRQPLLWVSGLILGLMAFGATTTDAIQVGGAIGNVHRNAPVVVAQMLGVFTILSMFIVTIFIAGTVLRDSEVGISDMLFATPMRKYQYLLGRFSAGLLACLAIFVLIALGTVIGPAMPWVDAARVGPLPLSAYAWAFGFFVIPNLIFIGALLLLLAATTRSMMMVYIGVLAFFALWIAGGVLARDINNVWLPVLTDPFGIRAFGRATRYFSTAESNAGLPPIAGYLLANRALWLGVALLCFGATLVLFKPQRAGTGRRWFGKAKAAAVTAASPLAAAALPRRVPRFTAATGLIQCWHILRFDAMAVFKSVPFLVMLLFGLMNFITAATQSGAMFGTNVYPVTYLLLRTLQGSFGFLLVIVVTFYAGELIFKERQVKIADVADAMPVPDWAPLLAKSLALVGVIFGFMLGGALASICFQLIKGGVPLQPGLYLEGIALDTLGFVMLGLMALALQVLTNNKFIGYLLVIVYLVAQGVLGALNFEHNLYNFGSLPTLQYSDMNGYGHFLKGWSWFALYWSLGTLALLLVAQAFWVRGLSQRWGQRLRLARRRLAGRAGLSLSVPLALSVAAFIGSGAWIYYNTNVLNEYRPANLQMDDQARYEKTYRKYKDAPQPRVTDVRADVDIYPAELRVAIRGHYLMENKSALPQAELYIQRNADVETRFTNLPPHSVLFDDKKLGFSGIRLAQPLAPGARLDLAFEVDVRHRGFTNRGNADSVNLNGTFFNNSEYFPQFGYQDGGELRDRNERRKRGLGEPSRMAKLEDEKARANNVFGSTDWINFETTVSTSADQIAIAPGYLQKSWEQDGRRYFHYKMDRPMVGFFAYLSARWNVRKGDWHGVPIEVYYDAKHAYNVERMIDSTRKSLDYYSANFTPYQHRQVRILEFPNYRSFAQSFANTIPYSEAIGFIADLRDKSDIDYVFYVTAHEMAHQWWGHQVVGANVQGSTMLIESLAQYSALMVMEKEYGRDKLRRFLRYELDAYLRGRGGELLDEQPLLRVENQQYIHYNKGSLVFYRLRDEIGEEAVNRALKRFLQDKAYQQAPYTTSRELLGYLRAEAPPDKQALITDLFEKIVFYDNRVTAAKASRRADGQWDVSMTLHLAKLEADGKGKEMPRVYDEPVEIAVFARAPGAKENDERVLFKEKRLLTGTDPVVTVTVKEKPYEVGVDPYNKMIDRVPRDNRMEVSVE